jgi:hypothetical protein
MKTSKVVTAKAHQSIVRKSGAGLGGGVPGGFFSVFGGAACFFSDGDGTEPDFPGVGFDFSELMNYGTKLLVLNSKTDLAREEGAERQLIVPKLSSGTRFRSQVSGDIKYDAAV